MRFPGSAPSRTIGRLHDARLLRGVLVVALAWATQAAARVETVRWVQPDDRHVVAFRIHVGVSPGVYLGSLEVSPVPDADGIYAYDLFVEDDSTVFVAVTAINSQDLESELSNECPLLAFPTTSAIHQFLGAVDDVIPSAVNPTITPCPSLDAGEILQALQSGPICVCNDTGGVFGAPHTVLDCQAGACSIQLSCPSLRFGEGSGDLTEIDHCDDAELVFR